MFSSLRTSTKITLAFCPVIVVTLIVGIIGYRSIDHLSANTAVMGQVRIPSSIGIARIREGQQEVAYGARGLINPLYFDSKIRLQQYEIIEAGFRLLGDGLKAYESVQRSKEEESQWREAKTMLTVWRKLYEQIVDMSHEKDRMMASGITLTDAKMVTYDQRILDVCGPAREAMLASGEKIDGLIETIRRTSEDLTVETQQSATAAKTGMAVAILAGAIVLFLIGVLLTRSIVQTLRLLTSEAKRLAVSAVNGQLDVRGDPGIVSQEFRGIIVGVNDTLDALIHPLKLTASYVERISRGDIPGRITEDYKGDFGRIKDNLNTCVDIMGSLLRETQGLIKACNAGDLTARATGSSFQGAWRDLVDGVNLMLVPSHDAFVQVAEATDQVSSAASQIAEGAQSVSQGASEQASAIEETSSSLEEITGMTKQNAESAQQANSVAQNMRSLADKGNAAMEQMVSSMVRIREASATTSQIIRDINEITFQTNLLALNAAVEAARAGDAGRGFAVVAEEVRSLAQRSKEAAGKTEALINESVRLTGEGETVSKDATRQLSQMVDSIAKVSGLVEEIAASSSEQARGLEQLNKAVSQMDMVVQRNVSNAEESSSAAEELASQAEQLGAMMARFKLSRETSPRATKLRKSMLSPHLASAHKAGEAKPSPSEAKMPTNLHDF